jgi:hypothetical protein
MVGEVCSILLQGSKGHWPWIGWKEIRGHACH